jgi:hypothetical protein
MSPVSNSNPSDSPAAPSIDLDVNNPDGLVPVDPTEFDDNGVNDDASAVDDDDDDDNPVPALIRPILHLPEFLVGNDAAAFFESHGPDEMKNLDWMTPDLIKEVEACYPTASEVNQGTENSRDLDAFKRKAELLFPVGRVFASYKQLNQAAGRFLDAWAIQKVHVSKSIRCHFGKSTKKRKLNPDESKRRKRQTLKDVVDCPFVIKYSYVGYSHNMSTKKPDICYNVKITTADYNHTCTMNSVFHRQVGWNYVVAPERAPIG